MVASTPKKKSSNHKAYKIKKQKKVITHNELFPTLSEEYKQEIQATQKE